MTASPNALTNHEAAARLARDGYNELPSAKPRRPWAIDWEVIREPMFVLLIVAAAIYAARHRPACDQGLSVGARGNDRLGGKRVLLRPIKPEDGAQHRAFLDALTPDDLRYRTFIRARELHVTQLGRFTQIDYDREMAFVAVAETDAGPATLGVVRAIADADNQVARFAIIVRSDLKGKGLGSVLLCKMIDYCRQRRTRRLTGESPAGNDRLLALVRRHGFTVAPSPDGASVWFDVDIAQGGGER